MTELKAELVKHELLFKRPAKTSRDTLESKTAYYLILRSQSDSDLYGVGECSIIPGLSHDNAATYEDALNELVAKINDTGNADVDFDFDAYPSIEFGLEMALIDLDGGGQRVLFDNEFSQGDRDLAINGLVWMGSSAYMIEQIDQLLADDYKVLKLKIGNLDFEDELKIIKLIRKKHPAQEVEIRLDANGAFSPAEALEKLEALAKYDIHSVEQPIAKGQHEELAKLISSSPIDIALDEELIGIASYDDKLELLKQVKPQYLILKPSLLGGFSACEEWIEIAEDLHIGWWVTSALESNIGLNAIAQWVVDLEVTRPQGLGTGKLFSNNIGSPLVTEKGFLRFDTNRDWRLDLFE